MGLDGETDFPSYVERSNLGSATRDMDDSKDIETLARRAWAELVTTVLPAAASGRSWPVATPAAFERVLLDNVLGAPWETVIGRPSAETACALDLILALEMGERAREGLACLSEMNRRSLALRASHTGEPCPTVCGGRPEPQIDDLDVAALRRALTSQTHARKRRRAN